MNTTGSDPSNPPEILYHYTNSLGLEGILTSGELWATDILYLNDASEFEFYFSRVAESLARTDNHSTTGLVEVLDFVRGEIIKEVRLFVACFCELPNLLSQWRGYAGGIGGYSIGFRAGDLHDQKGFQFQKALYKADDQRRVLERVRKEAADEVIAAHGEAILDHADDIETWVETNPEFLAKFFLQMLLRGLQHTLKHPGFEDEREWRVVAYADATSANTSIEFRQGPLGITPFCRLDVKDDEGLPMVKEIWIGPNPHQDVVKEAIELRLRSARFPDGVVNVLKSEIPLRG